jgi:hypothetical protein
MSAMIAEMMPDLSHLSAEEREIIEQVFQRQRAEEQKEEEIAQWVPVKLTFYKCYFQKSRQRVGRS